MVECKYYKAYKHRDVLSNSYLGWQTLFSAADLLTRREINEYAGDL